MAEYYFGFHSDYMFKNEDKFTNLSEEQKSRWQDVFDVIQSWMSNGWSSHATCNFGSKDYYYNIDDNSLVTYDEFENDDSLKKSEDDYRTHTEPKNIFRVLLDCNLDDYMHSPHYWVDTEQWDDNHKPILCLYVYYGNPCDCPHSIGPDTLYAKFAEFRLQHLNYVDHWNFTREMIEPLYDKDYNKLCCDIIDNNGNIVNEILSKTDKIPDIAIELIERFYKDFRYNLCDYVNEMIAEAKKYRNLLGDFDDLFINNIYEMCQLPYQHYTEDDNEYKESLKCPFSKDDFRAKIYDKDSQEWLTNVFYELHELYEDYVKLVYDTLQEVLAERNIGNVKDFNWLNNCTDSLLDIALNMDSSTNEHISLFDEVSDIDAEDDIEADEEFLKAKKELEDFSKPVFYRNKPKWADKVHNFGDYLRYRDSDDFDDSDDE